MTFALNAQRAEAERRAGQAAESAKVKGKWTGHAKGSNEQYVQPGLGI